MTVAELALQASMRRFWTVIGFFASATPVGILLGVLLSSVSNSDAAASVSALASGELPCPTQCLSGSHAETLLQAYLLFLLHSSTILIFCFDHRHIPLRGIHGGHPQRACRAQPSNGKAGHADVRICSHVPVGHLGMTASSNFGASLSVVVV